MQEIQNRVVLIFGNEGSGREYLADWISTHREFFQLNSQIDTKTLKTHSQFAKTFDFTELNYEEKFSNILNKIPNNLKLVLSWMPFNHWEPDNFLIYYIKVPKEYGKYVALEFIRKNVMKPNTYFLKKYLHLIEDKRLVKQFLSGKRVLLDQYLIFEGKELTYQNRLDYLESLIRKYSFKDHFPNKFGIDWQDLFFGNENEMKSAAKKVVTDLNLPFETSNIDKIVERNTLNKKFLLEFDLEQSLQNYCNQIDNLTCVK